MACSHLTETKIQKCSAFFVLLIICTTWERNCGWRHSKWPRLFPIPLISKSDGEKRKETPRSVLIIPQRTYREIQRCLYFHLLESLASGSHLKFPGTQTLTTQPALLPHSPHHCTRPHCFPHSQSNLSLHLQSLISSPLVAFITLYPARILCSRDLSTSCWLSLSKDILSPLHLWETTPIPSAWAVIPRLPASMHYDELVWGTFFLSNDRRKCPLF